MRILVVGKGGREHALVRALAESPGNPELFCFPGSDAIFEMAKPVPADGLESLVAWMKSNAIDLCVAGEESYLVKGEGQRGFMSCHYIAGTVAYQYHINACLVKQPGKRKIIGRYHGNFTAIGFHFLNGIGRNFFEIGISTHANKLFAHGEMEKEIPATKKLRLP